MRQTAATNRSDMFDAATRSPPSPQRSLLLPIAITRARRYKDNCTTLHGRVRIGTYRACGMLCLAVERD